MFWQPLQHLFDLGQFRFDVGEIEQDLVISSALSVRRLNLLVERLHVLGVNSLVKPSRFPLRRSSFYRAASIVAWSIVTTDLAKAHFSVC